MDVVDEESDKVEKMNYLIAGLSSYNKYLKRNLNLEFDDTRVASTILSSPEKNENVQKIQESLTDNSDKLKPVGCLSRLANLEPKEQFLVNKRLSTRIKEIVAFIATVIPVIIAVITFVLRPFSS